MDDKSKRLTKIVIVSSAGVILLAACAIERAQEAAKAQSTMIGMPKEQVLSCMGPPARFAKTGKTVVWSYNSGNGERDSFGSAYGTGGWGWAGAFGSSFSQSKFCRVDIVMRDGRVTRVNYSGPTGGLLTEGEQCAYAVQNCAEASPADYAKHMPESDSTASLETNAEESRTSAPAPATLPTKHPDLGISGFTMTASKIQAVYSPGDPTGVVVQSVKAGGPADKAGIHPGDIIKKFDDKRISSIDDLNADVANEASGSEVKVLINRKGSMTVATVQL